MQQRFEQPDAKQLLGQLPGQVGGAGGGGGAGVQHLGEQLGQQSCVLAHGKGQAYNSIVAFQY